MYEYSCTRDGTNYLPFPSCLHSLVSFFVRFRLPSLFLSSSAFLPFLLPYLSFPYCLLCLFSYFLVLFLSYIFFQPTIPTYIPTYFHLVCNFLENFSFECFFLFCSPLSVSPFSLPLHFSNLLSSVFFFFFSREHYY
uniref:Uncharacterized protein n=1 Tax=Cacopsylla melanoneura TaxID=428564 RepID=A0A8D8ZE27_9HEMI